MGIIFAILLEELSGPVGSRGERHPDLGLGEDPSNGALIAMALRGSHLTGAGP